MRVQPHLLLCVASFLLGAAPGCSRQPAALAVARVGSQPILKADYEAAVQRRLARLQHHPQGRLPSGVEARLRHGVLQKLIDDSIVAQKAQELQLTVDEAQVQQQLTAQKERFLTPEAYATYLQRSNTDDLALQDELRRSLLHEQLVAKLAGPLSVSDEAVQAFFEENKQNYRQLPSLRARRLVVGVPASASPAERAAKLKQAQRLRKQLGRPNSDFAALAHKYSTGPEAAAGGDMGGLFSEGHLPADLDAAVMALQPNQISAPLPTRQGWEIVELLEKQPERSLPFDEVKQSIRSSLIARERAIRYREVEASLRAAIPVEILINLAQVSMPANAGIAAAQGQEEAPAADANCVPPADAVASPVAQPPPSLSPPP
jgi:parvulin-like peptidyl-prolyl isomerase